MANSFCWYELMTTDAAAAETFYRAVVGWDVQMMGTPDRPYRVLEAAGAGVGGIVALPEAALAAGARPMWVGYIEVEGVDAALARVIAAGGGGHRAAEDIPGVGRFAMVSDPQGAMLVLFTPASEAGRAPADPMAPGQVGWRELMASDLDAAFGFYAQMFGWTKGEGVQLGGDFGLYQPFLTGRGAAVGGMMKKPPSAPAVLWTYYVRVQSVTSAMAHITAGGGAVINGPHQAPGGDWIVQASDPQGGRFALMSSGA